MRMKEVIELFKKEVDRNFAWFKSNPSEIQDFIKQDKSIKFLVLKSMKVVKGFKDLREAMIWAQSEYKGEPFSVQEVELKTVALPLGFLSLKWD